MFGRTRIAGIVYAHIGHVLLTYSKRPESSTAN
jgi:hypothetical protein